jgi:N-acetylmuramoyl-L-alanine amidase
MPSAAHVFALAALLLASCASGSADVPVRSAPTRPRDSAAPSAPAPARRTEPAPAPAKRPAAARPAEATASIALTDAAAALGLKFSWIEPGRRALLSGRGQRMEFEARSREIEANGLRVFLGNAVQVKGDELAVSRIDYETCLIPILHPSRIRTAAPRPKIIALDPGHGGPDNGTQNVKLGLKEKVFTLDVALRLKSLLEVRGFKVVLTRDSDERVELLQRALIANRAGADLFLSIHFNSLPADTKTSGTEVFTFAPQYQRSTNSWSSQTDDTEDEAAPVNRYDAWSTVFAHALHRELIEDLKTFDRGKKLMHLGMLRGLKCPGALVESGFLSNPEEARKIATPAYRQQIASALASAIADYVRILDSSRR